MSANVGPPGCTIGAIKIVAVLAVLFGVLCVALFFLGTMFDGRNDLGGVFLVGVLVTWAITYWPLTLVIIGLLIWAWYYLT